MTMHDLTPEQRMMRKVAASERHLAQCWWRAHRKAMWDREGLVRPNYNMLAFTRMFKNMDEGMKKINKALGAFSTDEIAEQARWKGRKK